MVFIQPRVIDANKTYTKLQTVGDRLTPVVRMEIEKMIFENQMIVVAYVPELPKNQKPCYITQKGRYEGSFIRSGDGDRRLSPYELIVWQRGHASRILISNRLQRQVLMI